MNKSNIKPSVKIKNLFETTNTNEVRKFILEKTIYIQEIIRNTVLSIKKNKQYDIFSNNDATLSINMLSELYIKTTAVISDCTATTQSNDNTTNQEKVIDNLQKIIDKLSLIICGFGTNNIDDLLFISFGTEYTKLKSDNPIIQDKYNLIKKYVHPIGYKTIQWKQNTIKRESTSLCVDKLIDDFIPLETANMFECFEVDYSTRPYHTKVYGIRIIIQNERLKKTLIITGILDDIQIECLTNNYIKVRNEELTSLLSNVITEMDKKIMERVIETLTLKDYLIYGNNDIYKRIISIYSDVNLIKTGKIDITIKTFLDMNCFQRRSILMNLLIYNNDEDIKYICYLLYDLIAVNSSDSVSNNEQILIYDSLPHKIKALFKDSINCTIKYTNDMNQKFDLQRVSIEQQVYLLNANDTIKEKAMAKLKEIKGKSEESGGKAKQYLEGLLKIPFGVYREEPILKNMKIINNQFNKLLYDLSGSLKIDFDMKGFYTNTEILRNTEAIKNILFTTTKSRILQELKTINTIQDINKITLFLKSYNVLTDRIGEKRKKAEKVADLNNFLKNTENHSIIYDLNDTIFSKKQIPKRSKLFSDISTIENLGNSLINNVNNITATLDESIYSHEHAKNQILKIISQWINGEKEGYCFGFEGSPGIGKTSLAKYGLSNCLKDESGNPRPFSFIALGGSTNSSLLEGHGYTYVNSTWGKIVDILMETKCMNPIIYIDELDKVSKTENGKEIIGLLTHLIDSTQNDVFQDRYFSGINIDLSKVLFIFSYNDPENIDKILLDRIHRIKFDNLNTNDKLVISNKYIIPEINKKMGFQNTIEISSDVLENIIDNYTAEPGVRKLKEILFDLYGEINIELLKNNKEYNLPINITDELLEQYLKKYNKISNTLIHASPKIGIMNGLWANILGKGGIIPIQAVFFPTTSFLDLKLTGLQGDVMKESMNVAKSLAWLLTPLEKKQEWIKLFDETKCQGLHIHCPEGAVSKDGPSAGAAITSAIFSLFNNREIKNDIAITGEITLQGNITAIGGLDIKIIGGIKAGVKTFLFPQANEKDFKKFMNKYKDKRILENITFHKVNTIENVFEHIFV
uniref:Lon proteolytic domain-containing protein n=1 Tax=viral metagenome TaxID=1070528 RepID=A0A6C0DSY0_9ZZZZ